MYHARSKNRIIFVTMPLWTSKSNTDFQRTASRAQTGLTFCLSHLMGVRIACQMLRSVNHSLLVPAERPSPSLSTVVITGTGKSQLPRRYSEGMGIGFLQVPVQPRWDSPQDLMGFYNYIEGRFRPTDLARALYQVDAYNGEDKDPDLQYRMMMVLLDEMNLARVEYYFSDFLSRLESRPRRDQTDDEAARKVVDRAIVLRFAATRALRAEAPVGTIPERKALSCDRWNAWVRETGSLGCRSFCLVLIDSANIYRLDYAQ